MSIQFGDGHQKSVVALLNEQAEFIWRHLSDKARAWWCDQADNAEDTADLFMHWVREGCPKTTGSTTWAA